MTEYLFCYIQRDRFHMGNFYYTITQNTVRNNFRLVKKILVHKKKIDFLSIPFEIKCHADIKTHGDTQFIRASRYVHPTLEVRAHLPKIHWKALDCRQWETLRRKIVTNLRNHWVKFFGRNFVDDCLLFCCEAGRHKHYIVFTVRSSVYLLQIYLCI